MMKKLGPLLIIFLISISAIAQTAATPPKPEDTAKLEKDAVVFLRETLVDVSNMRSLENRISFSAELASLMWFHDQKEAKAMYAGTISDFKQLLIQLDAELNLPELPNDDSGPSFLFGGGRSPAQRKLRIAMAVRQQIAMSLAEHEPDLAYNFFYDTAAIISNPQFLVETEQSDRYFEFQLMKQIAETNAAKAAQFASDSLKKGIDYNHIELLKTIYAKDADKGVEFGAAILNRIKSDKESVKGLYIYSSLLNYGVENLQASRKTGGKKAIYSQSDLRDLADRFAQIILDDKGDEGTGMGYVEQIEKFAPGRGAQIRAKYKSRLGNNTGNAVSFGYGAANTASNVANVRAIRVEDSGVASNSNTANDAFEQRQIAEKEMMADIMKLGKSLPKEERQKIVEKARKIIIATPGKDKKITALSLLAAQVAKAGDKELANEIMVDAERLINPQPKNYRDFLFTWMVASGYAEANPDKAFPMLENTILRANETITAFVKVAEFIDVNEEMIADGEVQVGMFGGQMMRGITKDLGIATSTLMSLAKADFAKTKSLTNNFDRVELRVLAKMLVLRAVLDDKPKNRVGEPTDAIDVMLEADTNPPRR